ncbi:response regulator [Microbacterium phyllosphaerae]|uniref:response regulator n=1 Tax=Microbacterium phyllosphaerae TaxID=124798 RepID=UPI003266BEFE
MTISVLVVDDQPLVRHAVRDILVDGGLLVVGEASNGRDAVNAVVDTAPDVVLMDIRMPELDGIAATSLICADSSARAPSPTRSSAPSAPCTRGRRCSHHPRPGR